jgi:peptidoglycan biosynthesis protein MviN/MurJ (putative lipid II flippase)
VLALLVSAISFFNQLVIAHQFGAGHALDLYLVAISLPFLSIGLFGGLFAYGMVPELVRAQSSPESRGVMRAFLIGFLAIGALVAGGGIVLSPML